MFSSLFNVFLVLSTGVVFGYVAPETLARGVRFDGPVDPVWILAAAFPTLALRGTCLTVLGRIPGRVRDLNLRSVIPHLLSDLPITGARLFVGIVLYLGPSWTWADPAAALAIALVLVYEIVPLIRQAWQVLAENAPPHLSLDAIEASLTSVAGVLEVHDVHVWSVRPTLICMTGHVTVADMPVSGSTDPMTRLTEMAMERFGVLHSVFQMEAVRDLMR